MGLGVTPISGFTSDDILQLEEVIVTATRRAQSVQDIPYNITAVSSGAIQDSGASNLADLMKIVPGVVFADQGGRANAQNSSIVLRGLNVATQGNGAAFANLTVPTVSTYMDNTPLFLNLQLTDVDRVEVLRGPQGTLYGSGSLAGTMRFIHNRPEFDAVSGSVSAGVEFLGESDEQTYTADGVINLPVSDTLAFRLAAAYENDGGVIDSVGLYRRDSDGFAVLEDPANFVGSPAALAPTQQDTDETESFSARASILWQPSDRIEALFVYHHQTLEASGDSRRVAFQENQISEVPSLHDFEQDADLISLDIEADLGFATITSSTSYSEMEIEQLRDNTTIVGQLDESIGPCFIYGCFPRGIFAADEPGNREDFTQEFRLVSNGDGSIDWIAGAYYNKQEADLILDQVLLGYAQWANTPGTDALVGASVGVPGGVGLSFNDFFLAGFVANPSDENSQFFNDRNTEFEDMALYGELTWHVTEAWQVTLGARYFDQEYESKMFQVFSNCGIFCSQDGVNTRGVASSSQSESFEDVIFKFNTSYEIDSDTNFYFTWAEGFRHGGANALPVGAFDITADAVPYEADETQNWEVGVKGSLWNGQLDYTLAAFLIDWDKPQLDVFVSAAFLPAVVNGESARSEGIELELRGQLTENLMLTFGYNYTEAELTDDFSVGGVIGVDGSPLPGVADHMANVALDYNMPLGNTLELRWHLDGQYKGEAENALQANPGQRTLDSFSLWNASVSVEEENWTISAFVNNLFDEDNAVYTWGVIENVDAAARPRSAGVRAVYRF
nr:TonB-dependent receptor [Pseudomaricurvus alkylphenolicus]